MTHFRYERKFLVSNLTTHQVESVVKLHPAMFMEAYPPRQVNNIYFDTPDHTHFADNIDGALDRIKVRIRWYGDTFGVIKTPLLELKIKNGFVGRKETFPLSTLEVGQRIDLRELLDCLERSRLPDGVRARVKCLRPVLLNRYRRKYFRSADHRYRITLDSEAFWYRFGFLKNSFLDKLRDHTTVIVEVKYGEDGDDDADFITGQLPFRLTKSSKYVAGIERLFA